jgi:hypothetical protein
MYTLYNSSVDLDTRLATVPQPVFQYNTLLASLAIDSSQLTSSPKTQTPTNSELFNSTATGLTTESSEVYDLWSDCKGDSAFGIGCLAIT